jgi:acyl-CoA reductase-like NAD-dependent aldehyde dehydrogenase
MQDFKTLSFINGEWVGSANQIDVLNPATGKSLASVANASISDCLQAVDAAEP